MCAKRLRKMLGLTVLAVGLVIEIILQPGCEWPEPNPAFSVMTEEFLVITLPTDTVALEASIHMYTSTGSDAEVTAVWTLEEGPSPVAFEDAEALATTVTFERGGKYTFQVIATILESSSVGHVDVVVIPENGAMLTLYPHQLSSQSEVSVTEGGLVVLDSPAFDGDWTYATIVASRQGAYTSQYSGPRGSEIEVQLDPVEPDSFCGVFRLSEFTGMRLRRATYLKGANFSLWFGDQLVTQFVTDSLGRFSVEPLEPGAYEVVLEDDVCLSGEFPNRTTWPLVYENEEYMDFHMSCG